MVYGQILAAMERYDTPWSLVTGRARGLVPTRARVGDVTSLLSPLCCYITCFRLSAVSLFVSHLAPPVVR
jgi:hypothetical protein